MSEWQPIETAPRDETDILIARFKPGMWSRPPVVAGWYERGTDEPGWYGYDEPERQNISDPTHWMPIPPPPTT